MLQSSDNSLLILSDVLEETPNTMLTVGLGAAGRNDEEGMEVIEDVISVGHGGRYTAAELQPVNPSAAYKDAVADAVNGRG